MVKETGLCLELPKKWHYPLLNTTQETKKISVTFCQCLCAMFFLHAWSNDFTLIPWTAGMMQLQPNYLQQVKQGTTSRPSIPPCDF